MKYYAKYSDGKLLAIGTSYGDIEITCGEYNRLLTEICEKADLENKLYTNTITLDDVPTIWREEIQYRVEQRIKASGTMDELPISADEALSIILKL